MKYLGVAYYPEYWPEERWDEDIRLMREAHINMVRVGEFAWVAMEPAEGHFSLDWLHRLIGKMAQAEINILLCTPTAAPPAWLTTQYPETVLVKEDGRRHQHGIRRHYCPTNSIYREHAARITEKLTKDFSRYSNVVGWQIDNELGPERGWCCCEHCQARFRVWLRTRYGSLEELNSRWGTRFWGLDFSSWEQVRLGTPGGYPSILLDTNRFRSDSFVGFAIQQARIIRANHPGSIVTTNGMGPLFYHINYYDLFAEMDVAPDDCYFDIGTMDCDAIAMDAFRGYKEGTPFWINETGSGALSADKVPASGQLRAWAFSALARGCEAYCFFRWRTCLSGQEQELQGLLEYSGRPRRRYQAVKEVYAELESLWPDFEKIPLPEAEVAFIYDYDVDMGYKFCGINHHVQNFRRFRDIYKAFYDRNVQMDIIPPQRDLSRYNVIVLPSVTMVDEDFASRLREFVEGGGTVLSLPQLSCRDRNNNYLPECAPVGLRDLFGLRVEGGMYLRSCVGPDQSLVAPGSNYTDETPGVRISLGGREIEAKAEAWMEDIQIEGGKILGTYTDNDLADCPFLVENFTGAGRTLYLGAYPQQEIISALVNDIIAHSRISAGPDTPEWVEVLRRGGYTFVINHRAEPVRVPIEAQKALVGKYEDGKAILEPYDVCVLE